MAVFRRSIEMRRHFSSFFSNKFWERQTVKGCYFFESCLNQNVVFFEKKKIDFGKELDAAKAEAQAWKTIWSAGQGVTAINDTPTVAELVSLLQKEFKEALEAQSKNLDFYF